MEKEYDLEYGGKVEKFVFRRMSFGEKNRLIEESTDIKVVQGQQIIRVSLTKLVEGSILKTLIKAPFPVNPEVIQGLDPDFGEKLSEIVGEINNLNEKKKLSSDN